MLHRAFNIFGESPKYYTFVIKSSKNKDIYRAESESYF